MPAALPNPFQEALHSDEASSVTKTRSASWKVGVSRNPEIKGRGGKKEWRPHITGIKTVM